MTTLANQTTPTPQSQTRPRFSRTAWRRNLEGWLFASPWIIGFVFWTLGPMVASLFIAFTEWDLITSPRWIGEIKGDFRRLIGTTGKSPKFSTNLPNLLNPPKSPHKTQ